MALPPGFTLDKQQDQPKSGPPSGFTVDQSRQQLPESDPSSDDTTPFENFAIGAGRGLAGDVVGIGQLAGQVLPRSITDPIASSGPAQWLSRQANAPSSGIAEDIGNVLGGSLPFLWQPELGIGRAVAAAPRIGRGLRTAWDVIRNSTLPAVVQPTSAETAADPAKFLAEKRRQAEWGTATGEALRGVGKLARRGAQTLTAQQQRAQQAAQNAQRVQQAVARMNQQNTLQHAAAQTAHAAALARQADVPRQATQDVYAHALSLIGMRLRGAINLDHTTGPQIRRMIGDRLDSIYRQMSFDPNAGDFLGEASRIRNQIAEQITDPAARNDWNRFFADTAVTPAFGGEPGARGGMVGGFQFEPEARPRPMAEMGQRSGPLTGDKLAQFVSGLTKQQQEWGRLSQGGGGDVYRRMSEGLRQIKNSVDAQLDAANPGLAAQRRAANEAYYLTSRVIDGIDVTGRATPRQLLGAFRAAEGDTRFGTGPHQGIKNRLQTQLREHEIDPTPPRVPVTVRGPPQPAAPQGTQPSPLATHLVGHAARHALGPGAGMAARALMRGRQALRRPLGGVGSLLERGAPVGSTIAGQQTSDQGQELVVTPRGAHWRDIQERP